METQCTSSLAASFDGALFSHGWMDELWDRFYTEAPKELLTKAGLVVKEPAEGHLCCGSAGTYNILQPDIAKTLRDRKVKNIERTGAVLIATGNIGCMTQIRSGTALPIVHTVELLDWAWGGAKPDGL